jgi:hypothetical protein
MDLKTLAKQLKVREILLLTSKLVRPSLVELINSSSLFADEKLQIHIEIPDHHFWGGNIIVGDLLVVSDFITCIEKWVKHHRHRPELVVIPSTPFSRWGRDLRGKVFLEIERQTGVPVKLLPCAEISL